jgi:transposase
MRVIGLDVHRSYAVVAIVEDTVLSNGGLVGLTRDTGVAFGRKLRSSNEVVIEATGSTAMIVRVLRPFVQQVMIAKPGRGARSHTPRSRSMRLCWPNYMPAAEAWMPDEATETLRRLVAQRSQIVQQMTRIKNRVHGVLHTNFIPPYDGELFSASGQV